MHTTAPTPPRWSDDPHRKILAKLYDRADTWARQAPGEPTRDAGQAGVGRRIAHWLYNSLKGACGLIIEKVAKGFFDSATKRP